MDLLENTFKYLDKLIHSGLKEIVLTSDIILDDNEFSQYLKGIKLDVDDFTIDGNNHTIDACNKTRIFYCIGKNITIKNIKLKKGFAEDGGAISNIGDVKFENCKFIDNTAFELGGAIYNSGELTITESMLKDNMAQEGNGGAVYNGGEFSITKSTLANNIAKRGGGAVYNGGEFSITESILINNISKRDGGAIFNKRGKLTITESMLKDNMAQEWNGGAVYNSGGLTITKSTLTNNMAKMDGGAIYNHKGFLTITQSTLQKNTTQKDNSGIICKLFETHFFKRLAIYLAQSGGGAIYNNESELTIKESVLQENTTQRDGGAIYNNKSVVTITHSTLQENTTQRDGGAIYNNESELTITESVLQENTTKRDGGAIHTNGNVSIFNCEILRNMSLKNIINNEDYLKSFNSNFKGNIAENIFSNNGGESNLAIFNGYFINNNVSGSIVFNSGKFCIIEKSIFEDNNSSKNITNHSDLTLIDPKISDEGKTILNESHILIKRSTQDFSSKISGKGKSDVDINMIPKDEKFDFRYLDKKIHENSTDELILEEDIYFEDYEMDYYEGGIELDNDDMVIDGNGHTIDGANKTRIFVITGNNIVLKNITFENGHSHKNYDNPTNNHGGAIKINNNCNVTIENCKFLNNTSEEDGGAIQNYGELTITESTLQKNIAYKDGGAIRNYGELTITESTLQKNIAYKDGGAINSSYSKSIWSIFTNEIRELKDNKPINNFYNPITITKSKINENMAKSEGGAIRNRYSRLILIKSTINENIAKKSSGGAIHSFDSELIINESHINENIAKGAAIYNYKCNLKIIDSNLHDNTTAKDMITPYTGRTIINCDLKNNVKFKQLIKYSRTVRWLLIGLILFIFGNIVFILSI